MCELRGGWPGCRENLLKHEKIYGLLTKCAVKKAGYILAEFFFCVFMDRGEVDFHKLEKKQADIQPS